MKQKSLKLNMVLNAVKGILGVLFPLISFPYVSRVLGVDNLGSYNFAVSIISYFSLFSGLGIPTYAIREGARLRNDTEKLKRFSDEMFTINMVATLISYMLLFICVLSIPKLANYKSLLIILSLQIVFKTIGIEWIYSIYEDYLYITIMSILFQIVSIALMFGFVRNPHDINAYAAITVVSAVGSNVLYYLHARKYCKIGFARMVNWKKHMKPILVLFAMTVTVTIYVSSDTTILGFLCSDHEVGIYSVSVKVYTIVKNIVASVVLVSIPRMSALLGMEKKNEFINVGSDIYGTLLTIMLPAMVGIIILREEIVQIISGNEYLEAVPSLAILSVAMVLCLGAYFWGQAVLVPAKKDGIVLVATIISAFVNILLNFLLIPLWKENAAALTTLISEGIAFLICRHEGTKILKLKDITQISLKTLCGCGAIIAYSIMLFCIKTHTVLYVFLMLLGSVSIFVIIEVILKNECILSLFRQFLSKFPKDK